MSDSHTAVELSLNCGLRAVRSARIDDGFGTALRPSCYPHIHVLWRDSR